MSDEVMLAITILILVLVVLIVVALVMAIKTMDSLRRNLEDLRQNPLSLGGDQYVVFQQGDLQQRGNDPLWSERPMTAGIEAASRLAYLTFSSPVIKTIALGSGTLRAVRSFRKS